MGQKKCVLKPGLLGVMHLMLSAIFVCASAVARDQSNGDVESEKSEVSRMKQMDASNIYDPEAYDDVPGVDVSGTYIFIKRGTISYTSDAGTKSESQNEFKRDIRQVVKLERRKDGEIYIYNVCADRDWGSLSRGKMKIVQHTDNRARLSGKYSARFSALSRESAPAEQILDPLTFGPNENGATDPITNVQVDATFDLVRIADFKSPIGRAGFSYSSGGSKGSIENACLFQSREYVRLHLVNTLPSNVAHLNYDVVHVISTDFKTSFLIDFGQSDKKALGVGAIGAMARFGLTFDSPLGETLYQDSRLKRMGGTGLVQHSIVKNSIEGLEFFGNAVPPGKADTRFSKKSKPLSYRLNFPLK